MTRRLLDFDPVTQVYTYHDYDADTDVTRITEVQDCAPVIERNKRMQNAGLESGGRLNNISRSTIKRDMWHVACIPIGVQLKWLGEGIDVYDKNHWPAVVRKLNDPEWRWLRTGTGRV